MPKTTAEKSPRWHQRIKDRLLAPSKPFLRYASASKSIIGDRRQNEDRCYHNDSDRFYMVSDGIGGYKGGALASQIAIETVPRFMHDLVACGIDRERFLTHAIRSAVGMAQSEMSRVAQDHPGYCRMGCTMATAFVVGDRLYYSSIGDCRVYLHRRDELVQLSRDESLVQDMVDARLITKRQASTHRLRHLVTNSISAEGVRHLPELGSLVVQSGDTVLLTTDGLVDALSDPEIGDVLQKTESPREAIELLIGIARERQAQDNVSCVVLQPRCSW